MAGTALVIASACVLNNYVDRNIDRNMARTQHRALVRGSISARSALLFAAVLGVLGTIILLYLTNVLTASIGIAGWVFYVVVYGIAKRRTVHSTLIGTISGALPPVAGYTAFTGNIDLLAVLLFIVLVFWQMAHFYAIALYRLDDYSAASIPVLPIIKGERRTQIETLAYVGGFTLTTIIMSILGYTGIVYAVIMLGLGIAWVRLGISGLHRSDSVQWGKHMFGFSLVVITIWSVLISIETLIP